ncbi:MAG: phosphoserine phosphatase SerB [Desulfovibrionales bacterium]
MRDIILITVTGPDKIGLTAALTDELSRFHVTILDISQAVIHNRLLLGLMIEVPPESESAPVLKQLMYVASKLGVDLSFSPIELSEYESWVSSHGKKRHIITLVGSVIRALDISRVAAIVMENDLNIEFINRLSGRISLQKADPDSRACIELSVRGTPRNITAMRSEFLQISQELGIDIGLQEDTPFRRNRRLVAFDMDSTLIDAEVIDELAKLAGAGDEVAGITASAMRGEIDFKESLRRRVGLLKGLSEDVLQEVAGQLPLTDGAERLISVLKALGYKIAILSGGFTYFGEHLKKRLGFDYVYANVLEIKNGQLTGKISGDIVDGPGKARLLSEIAQQENVNLQQVIAVGDGANDLPMLDIAGLGIAFHAKPLVKKGAKQAISHGGLDTILYFLGIRDREAVFD